MPTITHQSQMTPTSVPAVAGVNTTWVGEAGPDGRIAFVEFASGATEPLHRHATADEAVFILNGHAIARGPADDCDAPAGTLIVSSRGSWHSLRAVDGPVTALAMHAGANALTGLEAEIVTTTQPAGSGPRTVDSTSIEREKLHDPDRGFHHMAATFLAGESGLNGVDLIVGDAAYGIPNPDGGHALHRHTAATEFVFVRTGAAVHLTGSESIEVAAGDLVVIPAGEWHGIWNVGSEPSTALFGYLGCGQLQAAGYELPA